MNQEFDASRNTYINLDAAGTVRSLQHFDAPVEAAAATPQLAAGAYLEDFADLIGLEAGSLGALGLSPGKTITHDPVEYRFLLEKQLGGIITVAYQQTALSLPVWEAGVTVQLQANPLRVLSSQSTRHPDLAISPPSAAALKRAEKIDEAELADKLGLGGEGGSTGHKGLKIHDRSLVVYQYERQNIFRDRSGEQTPVPVPEVPEEPVEVLVEAAATHIHDGLPMPPLPPIPDSLEEGNHYVGVKVDFAMSSPTAGLLNWVAILEVTTLAVVYLRAFVDDVTGLVFAIEPETTNGGPAPSATSALLNPVRVSKTLTGLDAPVMGTQSLGGGIITLVDDEQPPTVAPPTEPSGTNFDFDARTDNFAAVNAYYHCDTFFRLVESMGFTLAGYFPGTTFPTPVDHRGKYLSADGIEVNAHCVGTVAGDGILRTTFMLADLGDTTNPIGLACDYRVVLHELGGHGVLYNHVSSANFHFSHSAGDSIAAILNDPGTQAANRFETFPWIPGAGRRHDRTPAGGWGYAGDIALHPFDTTLDKGGYKNEQILSSAHFRIYQSIGGDSTDLPTKQFAARMAVYLILKGISTLSQISSPTTADGWVTALQTADKDDWVSENITGGAYAKVIRWAFEKQGLFQPGGAATPNNNEGVPPVVDVYIDDGRGGEYQYQPDWWDNTNIWNRTAADGGTTHQDPIIGQTNYAYVKIKNRGSQTATGVVVKGFHANPSAGLRFPSDWLTMTTAQLAAPNVAANNAAEITVGPFQWVPFHLGHECMIMIVSASGDASNVDNIKPGDLIPDWRLVPNDNNIGQRNVAPVSGGGTSGLTAEFDGLDFELKNPMNAVAAMEVRALLPPLLAERGWKLEFTNRGGAAFPLQPGESRTVVMRLVPGAPFEALDVEKAAEKTIRVVGYAGGIRVGGLSYLLDPTLKHPRPKRPPRRQRGDRNECGRTAEALIDCLDLPEDVSRVRIRKITVDIEFDDDC